MILHHVIVGMYQDSELREDVDEKEDKKDIFTKLYDNEVENTDLAQMKIEKHDNSLNLSIKTSDEGD